MNNNIGSGKQKISVNIPAKLLIELDSDRNESKQDRSTWIAGAIIEKLSTIRKEKNA